MTDDFLTTEEAKEIIKAAMYKSSINEENKIELFETNDQKRANFRLTEDGEVRHVLVVHDETARQDEAVRAIKEGFDRRLNMIDSEKTLPLEVFAVFPNIREIDNPEWLNSNINGEAIRPETEILTLVTPEPRDFIMTDDQRWEEL